jgi:hypothetical protein
MGTPKTWKSVELRVAKFLGTTRNPLSGGNAKHTRSDSLHPTIFAETKHGQGCPQSWPGVLELFTETEKLAAAEGKKALLVLHRKGGANVADYDAYVRVTTLEGPAESLVVCVPLSVARDLLTAPPQRGEPAPPSAI